MTTDTVRKCYVCRRHIDGNTTFFVNPANGRVAGTGVAFCMECIPAQDVADASQP
jgi:hypothetical protein